MVQERSSINQLMVLSKIYEGKHSYSEIANTLGMTLQGVLYHVNALKESQYLDENGHVTKEGYEHLYHGFKDFSEIISRDLTSLHGDLMWEAVASTKIKKGDRLNLGMKDGYLNAGKNGSGRAEGISDRDAEPGEVIGIIGIKGIIGYEPGVIRVIVLPNVEDFKNAAKIREEVENLLIKGGKVGVIGEEAWKVGSDLGKIDFEYAVLEAAYDAAVRGLSTSVLVSNRRFTFLSRKLSEFSEQFPQIRISFHSI